MGKISVLLVTCAVALSFLGCGGERGPHSNTARLTLNGTVYVFKGIEFRIDVNPVIGLDNEMRTVESGQPQPIRYVLQTETYPELKDGKGFHIAWWIEGDSPMEALKGLVGHKLTQDPSGASRIGFSIKIEGNSFRHHDEHESWLSIEAVGEETVSGLFGGKFEMEKELTFENMGTEPKIVKVEEGYFKAPIKRFYKEGIR